MDTHFPLKPTSRSCSFLIGQRFPLALLARSSVGWAHSQAAKKKHLVPDMPQISDDTGCGLGCLLIALTFPVSVVIAFLTDRHKKRAEILEEQNRILRLEAEREVLEEDLEKTRTARQRRKMLEAGYVLCSRCKEWRDETDADGVCEPCRIMEEIET